MVNIQAGDILFIRGKSIISKAVRLFDKGEFSHVAIAVSDTHILEAQYYTRSHITLNHYEDYEILRLSNFNKLDFLEIAISLIGKRYDYLQIMGHMFNKNINNPNQLICSEMVAVLLTELYQIDNCSKILDMTPNELYTHLSKYDELKALA